MKTIWQISDSKSVFKSVFISIKIARKIVVNVTILSEKVILFTHLGTAILRFSRHRSQQISANKNENQRLACSLDLSLANKRINVGAYPRL